MADTVATPPPQTKSELPAMGFLDHLEELRRRIIYSAYFIAGGFAVCMFWSRRIFNLMEKPIVDALRDAKMDVSIVYTNPLDTFNMSIRIGMVAGIFAASPFLLYQLWAFIAPGLYKNERRYVLPFMVSTIGLFVMGGAFGYFVVYPEALKFFIHYGAGYEHLKPMITMNEYTSLFMTILLGLGVVFEIPIVIFFLALFGLISAKFMIKNFRYAILVIFIIAGVICPTPDVWNMCVFAAPMIFLYTISIVIAWWVHPSRRKRAKEA